MNVYRLVITTLIEGVCICCCGGNCVWCILEKKKCYGEIGKQTENVDYIRNKAHFMNDASLKLSIKE